MICKLVLMLMMTLKVVVLSDVESLSEKFASNSMKYCTFKWISLLACWYSIQLLEIAFGQYKTFDYPHIIMS